MARKNFTKDGFESVKKRMRKNLKLMAKEDFKAEKSKKIIDIDEEPTKKKRFGVKLMKFLKLAKAAGFRFQKRRNKYGDPFLQMLSVIRPSRHAKVRIYPTNEGGLLLSTNSLSAFVSTPEEAWRICKKMKVLRKLGERVQEGDIEEELLEDMED